MEIEPFFTRALGGKVSAAVVEEERRTRREAKAKAKGPLGKGGSGADTDPAAHDTAADRAGKVCWVPTKVKGADAMWPACALHPDDDRYLVRNTSHISRMSLYLLNSYSLTPISTGTSSRRRR